MTRSILGRAALALASLSLALSPAAASTITVKDGTGASQTLGTTTRPDGALIYNMDTVVQSTATDIGASVTANTAAQLAAANANRRGFTLQNQTTGNCWLSGLANATADFHSLLIPAGTGYESKDSHVGTGALSVICVQSGGLYGRQW